MNLSNFSQIRHNGKDISMAKLNGNVLWESYDKDFYVEYTVYPNDFQINHRYQSVYYANLPTLFINPMDVYSQVSYDKIEIILNDGTITSDTNVIARNVKSIKLWYPKEVGHLMFIGMSEQTVNYIRRLDFINITNLKSFRMMFSNAKYFITARFSIHFKNSGHIKDMSRMFYNCKSLFKGELADQIAFLTIEGMDVSGVTDMTEMFYGCSLLTEIRLGIWDTRNVLEAHDMFYGVSSSIDFNYDGTNYKNWTLTEEQTGFSGTFPWNQSKEELIASYTIGNPNQLHTFNDEFEYRQENIDNGNGTYTVNLYSDSDFTSFICNTNTLTIDYLKVTNKVTDMKNTFKGCSNLTSINVSNWDTSNVTKMSSMFSGCSKLTSLDLSNWDTSNVTTMSSMFYKCRIKKLDLSNFDTSNVTKMSSMFGYCYSLTSLDLSSFNTSNVTTMSNMFYFCIKLTSLDLSNFDTSNVTDMSYMFQNCTSLTSLDLSNFDTSNVTNMSWMFNECKSLISLELSNWETSNVTDMSYMFYYCPLTTLDLSSFDTSNVTNMVSMIGACTKLTSLNLSNFNTSNVTINKAIGMLEYLPVTVDWCYDGTNYQNWTLTESETDYSGTFPWNQ